MIQRVWDGAWELGLIWFSQILTRKVWETLAFLSSRDLEREALPGASQSDPTRPPQTDLALGQRPVGCPPGGRGCWGAALAGAQHWCVQSRPHAVRQETGEVLSAAQMELWLGLAALAAPTGGHREVPGGTFPGAQAFLQPEGSLSWAARIPESWAYTQLGRAGPRAERNMDGPVS